MVGYERNGWDRMGWDRMGRDKKNWSSQLDGPDEFQKSRGRVTENRDVL